MRWLTLVIGMVCAGCVTGIHERRIMQATDENGRVGYYQVQVDGSAKLAKTSYRSGLYDSDALDALFGSVKEGGGDIHDHLARRRSEAVDQLAAAYFEQVGQSTDPADLAAAERRLALALRSPYLVAADKDLAGRTVDRRKYAVILSAKASEIEKAIADFTEAQQTTDTVMAALAAQRRAEYLRLQGLSDRLERAEVRMRQLCSEAAGLQKKGPGTTKAERAHYVIQAADLLEAVQRLEVQ